MRTWWSGKRGGLLAFVAICALVAGGLGWVTLAALRLERDALVQQAEVDHAERLRLALWRLDSRMAAILAREDSRPFNHYSAVYAPPLALSRGGTAWPHGTVLEASPLLAAELPPWMLLHFQTDARGWESPQVLTPRLRTWLTRPPGQIPLPNTTPARQRLLADLSKELPAIALLAHARRHAGETTIQDRVLLAQQQVEQVISNSINAEVQSQAAIGNYREFLSRAGNQSKLAYAQKNEQRLDKDLARLNFDRNGLQWIDPPRAAPPTSGSDPSSVTNGVLNQPYYQRVPGAPRAELTVRMSPTVGVWLPTASGSDRLVALRMVRLEGQEICQGIVLDGDRLAALLGEEVQDLFAGARVVPVRGEPAAEQLPQTMTTLPLRLEPGPVADPDDPGWTPLRVGLSLAWAAALLGLGAVGLGGWSLIDLSQRRIRFVSAVTHELRTPLTTLRLYLDMLLDGLVQGEEKRNEYLHTLHLEADRLSRLVGNVLDFSRLEDQRPKLLLTAVSAGDLLGQAAATWTARCQAAGKELIIVPPPADARLLTDADLLGQVLGNLIDNACKYSREADDRRIWLRLTAEGRTVAFEVEDRGPGVPPAERRAIFRPFRRGRQADATTGGVGLGLALARRWTRLLGGKLTVRAPAEGGACFRVELPAGGG